MLSPMRLFVQEAGYEAGAEDGAGHAASCAERFIRQSLRFPSAFYASAQLNLRDKLSIRFLQLSEGEPSIWTNT